MENINFSWDSKKAQSNETKHKITFEEAKTVFDDENNIRIISARKSTKKEQKQYREYLL